VLRGRAAAGRPRGALRGRLPPDTPRGRRRTGARFVVRAIQGAEERLHALLPRPTQLPLPGKSLRFTPLAQQFEVQMRCVQYTTYSSLGGCSKARSISVSAVNMYNLSNCSLIMLLYWPPP